MRRPLAGILLTFLTVIPVAAPAQGRSAQSARWHEAVAARQALDDSLQPGGAAVLRAMDAELTLGRPDRATLLLARHAIADPELEQRKLDLAAAGAYGAGHHRRAGELYASAASIATGRARGVLLARAGEAFARGGAPASAQAAYRAAREALDAIAGWLAMREAQVTTDTSVAFALLERAPPAARRLVPRVRGEFFTLAGDTARAVAILAAAGFDGRAAGLALSSRDSVNARQLAYRALRSGDTAISNAGAALANGPLPPGTVEEFVLLGRATRRLSAERAAGLVGRAVSAGDSSERTLLLWGDLLGEARLYERALPAYSRAARGSGADAAQAQFFVARTLIRLGRPLAASVALRTFSEAHPEHSALPLAAFLLADLRQEAGDRTQGDSIYRALVERWPQHDYASQARVRLASRALLRGDTARAAEWYRDEVAARGIQQNIARYLLGEFAARQDDSAGARAQWENLVRVDSLGYYGTLARGRLKLGPPTIEPAAPAAPSGELARALVELDLLDEVGFADEAATLINWLAANAGDGDQALDLAEALVRRGRPTQAVSLGWRASRTRTLNDARVLRAIYPWPMREVMTAEAAEFKLDPYLVAALVRQESSFDIGARSRAGARGLMQLMPGTARQAAKRLGLEWSDHLLHVPDANLHVGAAHLSTLLRHFRGDLVPTLAAYNAGLRPVTLWRRFPEAKDPALFVERIPYAETRGYVRSILRNLSIYRALYPPTS